MDHEDIQVTPVPSGWHVSGFLGADIGGKLRSLLDSLGAPREAGDTRTGSQRRVDAFGELVDTVLAHGLPPDRGVRPHLSIHVDAGALRGEASEPPASLAGFGAIGPQLLEYLICVGDLTAFLVRQHGDGHADVLDVGRTRRLASRTQRRAVLARQRDECAAPGCRNTHLEIHHAHWWSHGGPTDLDNLIGLCPRCHRLVHRGLLTISANGHGRFEFHDHDTRPIQRAWRKRLAQHRRQRGDPALVPS